VQKVRILHSTVIQLDKIAFSNLDRELALRLLPVYFSLLGHFCHILTKDSKYQQIRFILAKYIAYLITISTC